MLYQAVLKVCLCPQLYDKADMQEEKVRISRSLGVADQEKLIQRALDFAMSVSLAVDSGSSFVCHVCEFLVESLRGRWTLPCL